MQNNTPPRLCPYLTIEQAACMLQVSYSYVDSLVSKGALSGIRLPEIVDCPVRISTEALSSFLDGCTIKNGPTAQKENQDHQDRQVYTGVFSVPLFCS